MMPAVAAKVFIALGIAFVLACLWAGFCRGDAVSQTAKLQIRAFGSIISDRDDGTSRQRAIRIDRRHRIRDELKGLGKLAEKSDAQRFNVFHRAAFLAVRDDVETDLRK